MSIGRRLHRAAHEIREIPVEVPEFASPAVSLGSPHSIGRALVAAAPVVLLVAIVAVLLASVGTPPALDDGTTATEANASTTAAAETPASSVAVIAGNPEGRVDPSTVGVGSTVGGPTGADVDSTSEAVGAARTPPVAAALASTPLTPREEVALVTAAIQRPTGPSGDPFGSGVPDSLPLRGELGAR